MPFEDTTMRETLFARLAASTEGRGELSSGITVALGVFVAAAAVRS